MSLAGALEEYLRDPNFEQNRIEYKANKEAAERAERNGTVPPVPTSKPPERGTYILTNSIGGKLLTALPLQRLSPPHLLRILPLRMIHRLRAQVPRRRKT